MPKNGIVFHITKSHHLKQSRVLYDFCCCWLIGKNGTVVLKTLSQNVMTGNTLWFFLLYFSFLELLLFYLCHLDYFVQWTSGFLFLLIFHSFISWFRHSAFCCLFCFLFLFFFWLPDHVDRCLHVLISVPENDLQITITNYQTSTTLLLS